MILFAILAIMLSSTPVAFSSVMADPTPIIMPERGLCAHRGAMGTHPENTKSAFQAAIDMGAHMIEFDVHLTKDGKLVIIHDNSVDRTTNGKGKVADLTFKEIRRLDAGAWKSAIFKGEQVPTLREALEMMPTNIWLNVHVKSTTGIGGLVAKEIIRQNRKHQAFLACSKAVAEEARAVDKEIKICNMDRQSSDWDYVNLTIDQGADFIQLKGDITPEYEKLVSHLRSNNIRINYFGTDKKEELEELFTYGVDFPLVNKLKESILICKELGVEPWKPIMRR